MLITLAGLIICLPALVAAQRFPKVFVFDSDISTLTPTCKSALNRTVDCSWLFGDV